MLLYNFIDYTKKHEVAFNSGNYQVGVNDWVHYPGTHVCNANGTFSRLQQAISFFH